MSDEAAAPPHVPSLTELFFAFARVSLSGFGGVLPWARRMIVEQRRWMSAEEFNEAFALCQFLPGPNIVNFAVVYGARVRGVAGVLAALAALIGPPVALVIAAGALYAQYGDGEVLRRVLAGLAAAAAGLILATAGKMAAPLFARLGPAPAIALIAFVAVGLLRWPLALVLAGLVPLSIALAWWRR